MAPSVQSVGDFVSDRLQNGYSGALTLDERRRRMREGVEHVRNSVSPRPRRGNLHRQNSSSSHVTATSLNELASRYHTGDRWDTDTEHLDDASTIGSGRYVSAHQMKVQETGQLHDFAASPTPEGYSASELSNTEEEDDRASVAASVRTEPVTNPLHNHSAALAARGQNAWADANSNRPRTASNIGKSFGQLNGHQPQQHHFSRGSMINVSIPYHQTRPVPHSNNLRTRETSAPPSISPRARAFSPQAPRDLPGLNTVTNGYHHHPPTSHPMMNGNGRTPPIDEGEELPAEVMYGQARQIQITHKHSMSSLSQASQLSRTSSVNGLRDTKNAGRFRTKRSHAGLRRPRRNHTEVELDHTPLELSKMTFQQLQSEDFDVPPKKSVPAAGLDFPDNVETLEDKCDYLRKLPDHRTPASLDAGARSFHENFFANLAIDDYDECGDLIVAQLGSIMDRLRKVRQAKRKSAREFEDEVAKREELVSLRTDSLQKELQRLKRSGQEALTAAIASNAA